MGDSVERSPYAKWWTVLIAAAVAVTAALFGAAQSLVATAVIGGVTGLVGAFLSGVLYLRRLDELGREPRWSLLRRIVSPRGP